MLIFASLSAPRFLKQAIEISQRRIPGHPLLAQSIKTPATKPEPIERNKFLLIKSVIANVTRATNVSSALGRHPHSDEPFPFGICQLTEDLS